jgi:hypothetical protein
VYVYAEIRPPGAKPGTTVHHRVNEPSARRAPSLGDCAGNEAHRATEARTGGLGGTMYALQPRLSCQRGGLSGALREPLERNTMNARCGCPAKGTARRRSEGKAHLGPRVCLRGARGDSTKRFRVLAEAGP